MTPTPRAGTSPVDACRALRPGSLLLPGGIGAVPGRWLPRPARHCGPDRWSITLGAGPLRRSVICQVGSLWRLGEGTWRSITWEPREERGDLLPAEALLPTFRGEIGVQDSGTGPVLRLRGRYGPPAGRVGLLADSLLMRRIAQRTADRFLRDVARRLTASSLHHRGETAPL